MVNPNLSELIIFFKVWFSIDCLNKNKIIIYILICIQLHRFLICIKLIDRTKCHFKVNSIKQVLFLKHYTHPKKCKLFISEKVLIHNSSQSIFPPPPPRTQSFLSNFSFLMQLIPHLIFNLTFVFNRLKTIFSVGLNFFTTFVFLSLPL